MVDWKKRFDVPVALPDGSKIATLDQARRYLLALPEARHRDADVSAAIEAVLMAAEGRGPVMHANAGIGHVVNARRRFRRHNHQKRRRGASEGFRNII